MKQRRWVRAMGDGLAEWRGRMCGGGGDALEAAEDRLMQEKVIRPEIGLLFQLREGATGRRRLLIQEHCMESSALLAFSPGPGPDRLAKGPLCVGVARSVVPLMPRRVRHISTP